MAIFLFLAAACMEKKERRAVYYPVDSLLNAQATELVSMGASVRKDVSLGGRRSEVSVRPENIGQWKKELEIFEQLSDINKSVNENMYEVREGEDTRSNLRVKSLASRDPALRVQSVRFLYFKTADRLRRVEAVISEDNAMYKTRRTLVLEFEELHRRPLLSRYSVEGGQRILLGDSVEYLISGSILFPNP